MTTTEGGSVLPTHDDLTLATEKLAIATGDLDWITTGVHVAIDPENPPTISLEQVGALYLYARDCERWAKEIREDADRILADLEALYYGQATEANMTGSHARELVEVWHRESLAQAGESDA